MLLVAFFVVAVLLTLALAFIMARREETFQGAQGYSGYYGQSTFIKQSFFDMFVALNAQNRLVSVDGEVDLFRLILVARGMRAPQVPEKIYLNDAFKIQHVRTGRWIKIEGQGFSGGTSSTDAAIFSLQNKYTSAPCLPNAQEYDTEPSVNNVNLDPVFTGVDSRLKCGKRKLLVQTAGNKWALVGQCDGRKGGPLTYGNVNDWKCYEFELAGLNNIPQSDAIDDSSTKNVVSPTPPASHSSGPSTSHNTPPVTEPPSNNTPPASKSSEPSPSNNTPPASKSSEPSTSNDTPPASKSSEPSTSNDTHSVRLPVADAALKDPSYSGYYGQPTFIKQSPFGMFVGLKQNRLISEKGTPRTDANLFRFSLVARNPRVQNRRNDDVIYLNDAFKIQHVPTGSWIRIDGAGFSGGASIADAALFGLQNRYKSMCQPNAQEYDTDPSAKNFVGRQRLACGKRKLLVRTPENKWVRVGQCDGLNGGLLIFKDVNDARCFEFELVSV
jgi:hypothetical protein